MLARGQREFAGASALFAALCVALGVMAAGPGASAGVPSLSLYLDPAAEPRYDRAEDAVRVPVVLQGAEAGPVALTASLSGRVVATEGVEASPGAAMPVEMLIPRTALSHRVSAVRIEARSEWNPGIGGVMLQVWLPAPEHTMKPEGE